MIKDGADVGPIHLAVISLEDEREIERKPGSGENDSVDSVITQSAD